MAFEKDVFINCPFDDEYVDGLLKPMLYTLLKFGFNPRLALEISDSGEIRLEKILKLIAGSKYSIHDLSRIKAKKVDEYYRLNMPFELGIDYGIRKISDSPLADNRFLILEASRYEYMKALSDINGFDIKHHSNDPEKIIGCLHAWFIETVGLRKIETPRKIHYDFMDFNSSLYDEKLAFYSGQPNDKSKADEFAQDY